MNSSMHFNNGSMPVQRGTPRPAHRLEPQAPDARHAVIAVLAAASLSACAVGPDYVAPTRPDDGYYIANQHSSVGSPTSGGTDIQRISSGAPVRADWWTALGSSSLDQIVELALANNRTLDAARANLAKAHEGLVVARSGYYPQVNAATAASRTKFGATDLGPEAHTFPVFSAYTAGVEASYDLDMFGATRRGVELAGATTQVAEAALDAARLRVEGETVLESLQIASVRAQIDATQNVIASDEKTLSLVSTARKAGVATQLDLTTAQSQLDSDRALLPPLRQQLDVARDSLAVLIGQPPARWDAPDFTLASLTLPPDIPLTLPSELVRSRPDLRAAEARLHVANATVGVATADMYPKITLSANLAEEGLLSGPAGAAWSLIGGITVPVFHGGALNARRRAAQDAYRSTYADYQQTVLVAFREVADNLSALSNSADEVSAQQRALDSANDALRLSRLGYGVGNAGIVQVLDAQRLQQLAELRLVQARTSRFVATVNLNLSTGGGIEDPSRGGQAYATPQ